MIRALLSLAFLSATLVAAERPKGFLGINWGASPEEAKRIMQARPGVKFPEESDDYRFEITGGTFAGQAVAKWVLEFPDRKFASATVVIKSEGNAQSLYKDFRAQLVAKYGSATTDKKLGKGARRDAGGERQTSLGTQTIWKFVPNLKEKNNISIVCEIAGPNGQPVNDETQLLLSIKYVNNTLTSAAEAQAAAGAKVAPTGVKKDEL